MGDERTRRIFRAVLAEQVEEVVTARKGIWGGRNGREDFPFGFRERFRTDWLSKNKLDKRRRNDDEQAAKRQRVDEGKPELPIYATKFSDEVLAAEERRPKKKVAVLIGYAGTGYRGMQL